MTEHTGESVFDWIDARAEARAKAGLTRRVRPRAATGGALDLAGNDYLGLARDKRVVGAAAAASMRWGAGSTGSRLVTGSTELHTELEYELANFCGAQAALVFSSGYAANLGALTALSGPGTAIVADQNIHASLIDGCKLSRADVVVAGHRDLPQVTRALSTRGKRRGLVVTDSVFSVDGDTAPLGELAAACREHDAGLVVDDAHGLGVVGDGGRGAVHAAGLAKSPDVVTTVTLSKALGAQGGAVLGPGRVIRHLVDTARTFIFDTGLAPGSAAAALAALKALKEEPGRPERVREVARQLSERLRERGFRASEPSAAVVSVLAPSPEVAVAWAEACRERGVLVGCFRPPSVPDQVSRLRLTARADLSEADVARAVEVIAETGASAGAGSRPR
ncbi:MULTISPECIES: 8-amino-7-oxononanoate synthase [Actinosynnema]|uniref:8-amino-7-oxononanoate synthase n=1 Tax=Actinosynnema TaxID=40566 RepID=UPI0020A2E5CE|nr:8-amino-7-oxononanoate synthase [Actinosynnema pretiosum]MCP2094027.1 8-amino-7-oxononanoate synthase [Actinosynnema pretiosum]